MRGRAGKCGGGGVDEGARAMASKGGAYGGDGDGGDGDGGGGKGVDSDGDGGGEGGGGRGDGGGGSGEGDGGNRDGSGGDRGGNGDSDGKVLTTSKAARATMTVTCGGIRQQRRAAGGGGRRQRKDRNQVVMEVARTESEVLTPFLFGWRLISKWPRRLCNDLARSLRRRQ